MAIIRDPEGNEIANLSALVDLKDLKVLEVGCGEGRLTWGYAENTSHITAIDPDGKAIEAAQTNIPDKLKGRISFAESTIEDYAMLFSNQRYDVALFSWSL